MFSIGNRCLTRGEGLRLELQRQKRVFSSLAESSEVDIDAKSMHIAIDGSGEAQAYRFDPKGKAIYPIVVAQTAFRSLA